MGDNSTYVQCFMFQRNIPLTSFFMLSVYLRYFVSWLSFLKTIQHKFSRGFFLLWLYLFEGLGLAGWVQKSILGSHAPCGTPFFCCFCQFLIWDLLDNVSGPIMRRIRDSDLIDFRKVRQRLKWRI